MEQRPLRLGDIVDDYCPRERRITNHVIVAIVDDAIRQTRCSTCDTEHVYKEARAPRRRGKGDEAGASDAALGQLVTRTSEPAPVAPMAAASEPAKPPASPEAPNRPAAPQMPEPAAAPVTHEERADDTWPAHRQLIRATLPRVEGDQKEPRPIPEFTMHQRQGRHGYRGEFWPNGNGNGRGNPSNNGGGGGGFRHGQPGQNQGAQPGGGGGKRWRRRRRGRKS